MNTQDAERKLEKRLRRERRADKKRRGMQVSGQSIKTLLIRKMEKLAKEKEKNA